MFLPFAIAHLLHSPLLHDAARADAKPRTVQVRPLAANAIENEDNLVEQRRSEKFAPGHRYVAGKANTTLNTWGRISPYGISIDPSHNIWNSGHVSGVVPVTSGYLVSADTGGVYLVTGTNSAVCVSYAWDKPDTHSMCLGEHGLRQVFVGGAGLYMTDWKSILPYFSWFPVDLSTAGDFGSINQVAVDPALGVVVIATSKNGILWSFIHDDPSKFVWHLAVGTSTTPSNCWTVAVAEPGTIVVGTVRNGALDPTSSIYYGSFDFGDGTYELTPSNLPVRVAPGKSMFCTSVCVDPLKPLNTYAVASDMKKSPRNGVGFVSKILSSKNGGLSWTECGYFIPGGGGTGDIRQQGGDQGYQYNNCIAAGGNGQVIVGWSACAFYSKDGGFNWTPLNMSWFFDGTNWDLNQNDWNIHPDYHTVGFRFPGSIYMLLGHDGGFTQVHGSFDSTANTFLPTMQFYENGFSVSPAVDGLCAGGNQDNGIPYTIAGASRPYQETELGFDGNESRFIKPGAMIFNHDNNSSYALWTGSSLDFTAYIPLTVPKPGQATSSTIPAGRFEPVPQPTFTRQGFNVYGVMAVGLDIYELMGDQTGGSLQYWYLGTLPGDPSSLSVSAIGMVNLGASGIFLATNDGSLWSMDPVAGSWLQLSVDPPKDGYGNPIGGQIDRIVLDSTSSVGYAVYNTGGGGYVLKTGVTLLDWHNYGSNVPTPDGHFYGLAVGEPSANGPATVYLASDANVYQSADGAGHWSLDTTGLPTRIHVRQLVFITQSDGTHWLYAPSYGSAVWRMQVP